MKKDFNEMSEAEQVQEMGKYAPVRRFTPEDRAKGVTTGELISGCFRDGWDYNEVKKDEDEISIVVDVWFVRGGDQIPPGPPAGQGTRTVCVPEGKWLGSNPAYDNARIVRRRAKVSDKQQQAWAIAQRDELDY